MPVPDIAGLPPFADFNDVTTKIDDLVQRLRQLLLNLDTLNIRELHASKLVAQSITGDKIEANSISANHIQANAITADKIEAGAVTADKIDVNELSAITANLGHITAGLIESVEIFGSYIATSKSYPKAELDSTDNLIGAYATLDNYIQIYTPNSGFSPTIKFGTPAGVAYITYDIFGNAISVTSSDAKINISTQQRIELFAQGGVFVTDWRDFKNNTTGRSLQDDFVMK
ncbi:hypothetical protein [Paenibacillus sp. DMB20]|uniref:hypothetical protein n=1 Tax=Paenibacillus sp. DMB20 TaxID=1642570 RepID=UPI000627AC17|nr:hypothetical protein [Paenibacillus sp. DMB20]KKO51156.1 hypothetical protein XI25_29660 [Paenibacillus sp. DMB20]